MSSDSLQLSELDEVDAGAEAQRERDVGQQHEPEPDPADRAGLAQLGLRAASRPDVVNFCSACLPRPNALRTRMPCTLSSTEVARSPAWSWLWRASEP